VAKSQRVDDRLDLIRVKSQPARAQSRPNPLSSPAERRNLASRRALVRRVQGEFLEDWLQAEQEVNAGVRPG
jgi:hypothetical protein